MSVQASGPTTCSRCFVPFSKREKPYGHGRFPIDCIICVGNSIFNIAKHDNQTLSCLPSCNGIMPLLLPDFHVDLINQHTDLQEHLIQKIISLVDSVFDRSETRLKQEAAKIHLRVIDLSRQIEHEKKKPIGFKTAKGEEAKGEELIQIIKLALNLKKVANEGILLREKAANEARQLQSRSTSTNVARGMQKLIEGESSRQNLANQAEATATATVAPVALSSKAEAAAAAVRKAVKEREMLQRQHSANAAASYQYDPLSLHQL